MTFFGINGKAWEVETIISMMLVWERNSLLPIFFLFFLNCLAVCIELYASIFLRVDLNGI